jgi:site-specific DNA-methyltransferase (adenine-specific)
MIKLIQGDCLEEMDKLIEEGVVVDAIITDPPYGTTACNWKDLFPKENRYFETENGILYNAEAIETMSKFPENIFDAIITDPPYGTTQCKWDSVIQFDDMWTCLKRIAKNNRAIVLFGSEPFSSYLRTSFMKGFKYDWIWDKTFGRQPQLANIQPMKQHEIISIFEKNGKKVMYNPQKMLLKKPYKSNGAGNNAGTKNHHKLGLKKMPKIYTHKTPTTILSYKPVSNTKVKHPTQKPLELLEYLIKTYTNEGDLVLDFTCGSGTTLVACEKLNRRWIGIEINPEYCEIAKKRIEETIRQRELFEVKK